MAKITNAQRAELLNEVEASAYVAGTAISNSTEFVRKACAPIGFTTTDGKRVPNNATQKRIDACRPRWTLGFIASQVHQANPKMTREQATERAQAIIDGIPSTSKQSAGNKHRRSKAEDTMMANSRQYWKRATNAAGIVSTDPRAGNKNASGAQGKGSKSKGKSEAANSKAAKPEVGAPKAPKDASELWDYAATQATAMHAYFNKKHAKICPNALSRIVDDFHKAIRSAMPSE